MNLEQLKARLAEIKSEMNEFSNKSDFSDADTDAINALSNEFENTQKKVVAMEKMAAVNTAANVSNRKTGTEANASSTVPAAKTPANAGFKSAGEFLMAVRKAATGDVDVRFKNEFQERNGEDGGFLVPDEILAGITKKMQSDESLFAKTRQLTCSGNSLSLNVDESAPWNGGVQAYWTAEGAPIQQSGKGKITQAHWKLHKLAALVTVTDELLEDAVALESYMKEMAPEAIMHKLNSAILSGDGVGKPQGILGSTFKIIAAKESAQPADTIVARNVIKMYSKMIPAARSGAVWYINAGCEEQLRTMKDDLGNFIYLAPGSQMNQSPYGQLLGLPVIPMIGSMPALGDEGDIILANLSYYYSLTKSNGGIKQAVSSHIYFDRDVQAYKFTIRIDGSCPFKSPVTTEFGNYQMSAFITLEAR